MMDTREITRSTDLCDENGQLSIDSVGWAKHPLIRCNLKGNFLRKKKWNYWCVTSPELLFSATISHLDYAAVMFIYVLDLKSLDFQEKTTLIPFGRGFEMPDGVNDSIHFKGKDMRISFKEQGDSTVIQVKCLNFGGKSQSLSAHLTVERPPEIESVNVVVPWSKSRFQFTSKQVTLPTEGVVEWNGQSYIFEPDTAFSCLDFGRGVWPYHSTWNWASASGVVGGKKVGLNFGGQWTDGTGQTENGIVVNGKLSKINEKISWSYDTQNYMKPWHLNTEKSDQISLTFTPMFERIAATKAIIVRSEVHQMIGTFSGSIITDEGERIMIDSLLGWAEDHEANW
jgi:hypothetical protein